MITHTASTEAQFHPRSPTGLADMRNHHARIVGEAPSRPTSIKSTTWSFAAGLFNCFRNPVVSAPTPGTLGRDASLVASSKASDDATPLPTCPTAVPELNSAISAIMSSAVAGKPLRASFTCTSVIWIFLTSEPWRKQEHAARRIQAPARSHGVRWRTISRNFLGVIPTMIATASEAPWMDPEVGRNPR